MSDLSVVLLNWNGWRDTLECLESLFVTGATPCRVLVCDNNSHDESLVQLSAWGVRRFGDRFERISRVEIDGGASLSDGTVLALVENGANLGFAAGNNVGIRLALRDRRCEYVWVLNNDTVVQPDALRRAVERMRDDPHVGLCGSTLVYSDDPEKVQALGGATYSRWSGRTRHVGAFTHVKQVPSSGGALESSFSYVVGAAMLASRAFLERVGLMCEDYFLYCEEIDWATRGAMQGFKLGYAPASLVFHKEGASIGTTASGGSPLSLYFLFRNRLRFAWRFHSAFAPSVFVFCLLDVAKLSARRRWPQAVAALRGVLQLQLVAASKGR